MLQALPPSVDLRPKCPPVYNQGSLGSCTANAIAGALEFLQMAEGLPQVFTPSRLFIYYNERAMEGTVDSDSGAMIRDGIKSVNAQGAPRNRSGRTTSRISRRNPPPRRTRRPARTPRSPTWA